MKELFDLKQESEMQECIRQKMKEYKEDSGEFSNTIICEEMQFLLLRYILTDRPREEWTVDSMSKVLGASLKEKGYKTPFWVLVEQCYKEHPGDAVLEKSELLRQQIRNTDLNEIFAFYEWWIMQECDKTFGMEDVEKELGSLAAAKVQYLRTGKQKLILQHKPKEMQELPVTFKEQCQKFVDEYTPEKIKEYLDRHIIGQEDAKRNIATAVYNHYLRILHPDLKLVKSNVIMIGPSGCGKTEIIRRIMDLVNVPIIISDFSGVVATPWKGRNKEEALFNLYQKAGKNVKLAECGIIFFDEFDKIIPTRKYIYGGDVNMELQGQMLGMMEGTLIDVPDPANRNAFIPMHTEQMLFICAGAFEGLEEIVRKDMLQESSGFGMVISKNSDMEITNENIKVSHLLEYGMKPELAGRIGTISVLQKLSREELRRVLTEPEESIVNQYKKEFELLDDLTLTFTDDALEAIIDQVMKMSIGARAINAVLHDVLQEALFEAPTMGGIQEVIITEATVREGAAPEYR